MHWTIPKQLAIAATLLFALAGTAYADPGGTVTNDEQAVPPDIVNVQHAATPIDGQITPVEIDVAALKPDAPTAVPPPEIAADTTGHRCADGAACVEPNLVADHHSHAHEGVPLAEGTPHWRAHPGYAIGIDGGRAQMDGTHDVALANSHRATLPDGGRITANVDANPPDEVGWNAYRGLGGSSYGLYPDGAVNNVTVTRYHLAA